MSQVTETFEQYASRISGLEFSQISPEMRVTLNGQYQTAYPPGKNSFINCSVLLYEGIEPKSQEYQKV